MLHTFEFNGKKLINIGAVITEPPHYTISMRELEFSSLPKKSGDVVVDKKRFKNRTISYKISSVPYLHSYTEQQFVNILSEWLLTSYEYKALRDTYNLGYFRKAVCTEISDPKVDATGVVSATVTFNCDPFLYNNNGVKPITQSGTGTFTLKNPEEWSSEPVITVNGNGDFTVNVNGESFDITLNGNAVVIDKPAENVYYLSTKAACNDIITASELPELKTDMNTIQVTTTSGTGFTMSITPNWRRL